MTALTWIIPILTSAVIGILWLLAVMATACDEPDDGEEDTYTWPLDGAP